MIKKNTLKFGMADDAVFGRSRSLRASVTFQEPAPARFDWRRVREIVAYAALVAGVGLAVFVASTPAHSAGAFGIDVKVVHVSPSVTYFGDTKEGRKLRADVAREGVKHQNRMEEIDRKAEHQRALEADRAYYKKLADQRKKR